MLLATLLLGVTPQITAITISIALDGDTAALVQAEYQLAEGVVEVHTTVLRFPGQAFAIEGDQASVETEQDALIRLVFRVGPTGGQRAGGRYSVRGDLSRIPIPVPVIPTARGAGRVRILVSGLPETAPVDRAFPRLRWSETVAEATLDNVPALLRVARTDHFWSMGRISERVVMVLVVLASGAWIVRNRAHRRVS